MEKKKLDMMKKTQKLMFSCDSKYIFQKIPT
jgi:hypothetical protein